MPHDSTGGLSAALLMKTPRPLRGSFVRQLPPSGPRETPLALLRRSFGDTSGEPRGASGHERADAGGVRRGRWAEPLLQGLGRPVIGLRR